MLMDITPYVDGLRRDLTAAAEAGGEELRQAAERLAFALEPAARLALMEAISHAAAEITTEPSPTADATRLADSACTSPATNTPGTLVSR